MEYFTRIALLAPRSHRPPRERRSRRRARVLFPPDADHLECRALLSTLTVMTAGDDGAGSLRQTIGSAHENDTITFASALAGKTIQLSGPLMLDKSLDFEGAGDASVSIQSWSGPAF